MTEGRLEPEFLWATALPDPVVVYGPMYHNSDKWTETSERKTPIANGVYVF